MSATPRNAATAIWEYGKLAIWLGPHGGGGDFEGGERYSGFDERRPATEFKIVKILGTIRFFYARSAVDIFMGGKKRNF